MAVSVMKNLIPLLALLVSSLSFTAIAQNLPEVHV
jgi:hypothetical protein